MTNEIKVQPQEDFFDRVIYTLSVGPKYSETIGLKIMLQEDNRFSVFMELYGKNEVTKQYGHFSLVDQGNTKDKLIEKNIESFSKASFKAIEVIIAELFLNQDLVLNDINRITESEKFSDGKNADYIEIHTYSSLRRARSESVLKIKRTEKNEYSVFIELFNEDGYTDGLLGKKIWYPESYAKDEIIGLNIKRISQARLIVLDTITEVFNRIFNNLRVKQFYKIDDYNDTDMSLDEDNHERRDLSSIFKFNK